MDKIKGYFSSPTSVRTISVISLLLLVAAIPLTVFLAGQQQETRQQAAKQKLSQYKVFLSSQIYSGNLGGITGADAKCQQLATAASFPGRWVAWISDATSNAKDRIVDAEYLRIDGKRIAKNKEDLLDSKIKKEILLDEKRQKHSQPVWTGTKANGEKAQETCNSWVDESATTKGVFGVTTEKGKGDWTEQNTSTCTGTFSLYCFEQPASSTTTPTPTPNNCASNTNKPAGCACNNDKQCVSDVCEHRGGTGQSGGQKICQGSTENGCNIAKNKPGGCECRNKNQCTSAKCERDQAKGGQKFCTGAGVTPTPTPTGSQNPTATPTPTITPECQTNSDCTGGNICVSGACVPPGTTPTNTPTPPPGGSQNVTVSLQGIGGSGGNSNPTNAQKNLTLEFFDTTTDQQVGSTIPVAVSFNATSGTFTGTADLSSIPQGTYDVKIKAPKYLKKAILNQPVTASGAQLRSATLVVGDVNDDNIIDILDYNIISNVCFGSKFSLSDSCTDADLNDDGKVDIIDANFMFRNIAIRRGD